MSITIPGTYEGLLQKCSPVAFRVGGATGVVCFFADFKEPNIPHVCWKPELPAHPSHPSSIGLDLTDETGRDHARGWVARKFGHSGGGFSWWTHSTHGGPLTWMLSRPGSPIAEGFQVQFWAGDGYRPRPPIHGRVVLVPALASVDHTDPRKLPDGSSRAAAVALMHTCKHLHREAQ